MVAASMAVFDIEMRPIVFLRDRGFCVGGIYCVSGVGVGRVMSHMKAYTHHAMDY